jgi:hypothetical protein
MFFGLVSESSRSAGERSCMVHDLSAWLQLIVAILTVIVAMLRIFGY